jgi:RNA ligase (TIGR02306 family)
VTLRKLASIQKIEEVAPIEKADAIEKTRVLGWWVVAKKDQFKVGDPCIYYEVDSLLPDLPQYSFLEKGHSLKESIIEDGTVVRGHRLRTIKLRGQISQGLVLPLSEFPYLSTTILGHDLTQELGVNKYDPLLPACLSGEAKGYFPGFIPKTDEERVQSFPGMLDKYRGQRFYITVKMDGSSCTCYKHENDFNVCGRTLNLFESEKNSFWNLANRLNLKEKLPNGFAIQSECAGEGVQSNRHVLKGQQLYLFYVYDILKAQYLKLDDMLLFAKDLGMKTVPILDDNFILNHTMDEIMALADGPCPYNPAVLREGLIYRLYDSTAKITFKTISNAYLLRYGL